MPNTILKRWNGSAFEELYPKTVTSQIAASGTANNTTFLRGDGQWIGPIASNITDSGNVGRNLLTTSSATASTLFFKKNPDHTITLEDAATFRTSIGAQATITNNVTSGGSSTVGSVPLWNNTSGTLLQAGYAVSDSSSAAALGTNQNFVTERDVYYGTPTINNSKAYTSSTSIYAPTAGGTAGQFLQAVGATSTPTWANLTTNIQTITNLAPNTYSTSVSVSGYRWVIITGFRNSAGTEVIFQTIVDLNDTNQWSTTARTRRIVWNNDTSTFADDLTIQDSTGLRLQFAAGINCNYRLDGVR